MFFLIFSSIIIVFLMKNTGAFFPGYFLFYFAMENAMQLYNRFLFWRISEAGAHGEVSQLCGRSQEPCQS